MKKLWFFILLIPILAACELPTDINDRDGGDNDDDSTAFGTVVIFDDNHTFIVDSQTEIVFNTIEEENEFLNSVEYLNQNSWEEVDYDKYTVIGMVLPPTSSGSYKLTLELEETTSGILVESELFIPCIGTDDIGHPAYFVKIPKTDRTITFKTLEIEREDCDDSDDNTDDSSKLENDWILIEYAEFNGAIRNEENTDVVLSEFTISFDDGSINGDAACNVFTGDYLNSGMGMLTFSNMTWTEAACPFSDTYLTSIQKTNSYDFDEEGNLILYVGERLDSSIIYLKYRTK